jgi:adenylate kinase family enzyme
LADAVIWFDLPRRICMTGIMTRIATSYGRVRPEMAAGCPEQIDVEFFRYVWSYRRLQRPKLLQYFEGLRPDQALICFTDRQQADEYLTKVAPAARAMGAH